MPLTGDEVRRPTLAELREASLTAIFDPIAGELARLEVVARTEFVQQMLLILGADREVEVLEWQENLSLGQMFAAWQFAIETGVFPPPNP